MRHRSKPAANPTAADSPPTLRPKTTSTLLMLLTTAILLPLLFPPFYCFFLAPFALVPLCVCILRRPMKPRYLFLYYLTGVAFFMPNLYWIAPVDILGYIALSLYVALYFPLFALGLHRLANGLRIPATFAVPLAWTAVEYVRCTFVEGGFPWFMLGNSFAPATALIQIADLFGVWGITFLIAMLNGLIVDLLRFPLMRDKKFSPVLRRLIATTAVVVTFTIAYGLFRLGEKTTTPGPRIAVIQENFPQKVKDSGDKDDVIFQNHLDLTKKAASANPPPDLIAWPETMVPGWSNPEFLQTPDSAFSGFGNPKFWKEFRDPGIGYMAVLSEISDRYNVPLLLGIGSIALPTTNDERDYLKLHTSWKPSDLDRWVKQNRTELLLPHRGPLESYAKIHLVPFGEYIPFRGLPYLGKYMALLAPYGYEFSNWPGKVWTRYHLAVRQPRELPESQPAASGDSLRPLTHTLRIYTFATPICFEDAMPEPARKMTAPQFAPDGVARKTDFLINVSNDGWFFSAELNQRLQASQLRAVENRVPIARAVNTGNSGFIDSCGRIIKLVTDHEGNSIHAVDTVAINISLDSRITLFSKIGDLLPILCGILSVLAIAWTFVRPRRDR